MSRPPNLIVFLTDQQRWDSLGAHGNPLGLTPNLDEAAARGTHFAKMFTPQPVCGPARSCLQTGRFATSTGCFRNGIPLPPDSPTIAKSLRNRGYQTAYIGKWHLGPPDSDGPVPASGRGGYEDWLAANILENTSDAYRTRLFNTAGHAVDLPGYRVDALTDAAIRWIANRPDTPFFLFLSFLEPHHQNHRDDFPAPDGYESRYAGGWVPPDLAALAGTAPRHLPGYWGMVKRLDEAYGRLRDALRSLSLDRNTTLWFTSDHGCHFKTRNAEYKRSCQDASLRVPGVVTGPGFDGGGRVGDLTSLIDLAPTLLDLAGADPLPGCHGRSLLPSARQNQTPRTHVFAQISESQVGRCIRTRRWKYSVSAKESDGWSESAADAYEEEFLYDLQADPWELNNLAGCQSHRRLADWLKTLLQQDIALVEGRSALIHNAPETPSGQLTVADADFR